MSGPETTLVTGGYGLLGLWLVPALLGRGDRVVVLRHRGSDGGLLAAEGLEARCRVVDGDVTDTALLRRALVEHGVQTVFHLAAQSIVATSALAPAATFDVNVRGTWSILEAARGSGVRRVVVASSARAYGPSDTTPRREDEPLRPAAPYDASKAAADVLARSYATSFRLPVATTRCANLYGGGDRRTSRLIPELVGAALAGRAPAIRSDGTPRHDFLYVEDAVGAYLAVADALDAGPARGEAFNAGGGDAVSVAAVADAVARAVAGAPPRDVADGAGPTLDLTKIARVCGWRPTTGLDEGLRRTVAWHRARGA